MLHEQHEYEKSLLQKQHDHEKSMLLKQREYDKLIAPHEHMRIDKKNHTVSEYPSTAFALTSNHKFLSP